MKKCIVYVKKAETGETRIDRSHEWDDSEDSAHGYMWGEGNFSCDCNRELFFCRAVDEDEPEESGCGDERFSVKITDEAGAVLYRDDRWTE